MELSSCLDLCAPWLEESSCFFPNFPPSLLVILALFLFFFFSWLYDSRQMCLLSDVQILISRTKWERRRRLAFTITRTEHTPCPMFRIKWAGTPSSSNTEATRFRLLRIESGRLRQAMLASARSRVSRKFQLRTKKAVFYLNTSLYVP